MIRNIPITRRSINELLQLLLSNIDRIRPDSIQGLCVLVHYLYCESTLNSTEFETLIAYIKNNKPLNYRTIFDFPYFWKKGERLPRIKWLNKHIRRTSLNK